MPSSMSDATTVKDFSKTTLSYEKIPEQEGGEEDVSTLVGNVQVMFACIAYSPTSVGL